VQYLSKELSKNCEIKKAKGTTPPPLFLTQKITKATVRLPIGFRHWHKIKKYFQFKEIILILMY
jgi:hypothetical protein